MWKKRKTTTPSKKTKRRSVDHVQLHHHHRKPRSPASLLRRTDFSLFFHSRSPSPRGLCLETLNRVGKLTTDTGLGEQLNERKESIELAACSSSEDKRRRLWSNTIDIPVNGVESVGQNVHFEASGGRNFDKQNGQSLRNLELISDKSQVKDSSSICVTPGTVVWAKAASQGWWPAEVMDERSTVVDSLNEGVHGLVLIQYYGTCQSAWLDPARQLSEFDECFEERSCNPADEFQDALKQALHQREHQSLSKQFSGLSDDGSRLNQGYQAPEKGNSSSSSRAESPYGAMRRGKRERKPKLHFDEEPLKLTLARGVRRIKIMRSLGLAAPVGSPF